MIAALFVSPAAHAVDLNGAWANDMSVCSKIFQKNNNAVSMTTRFRHVWQRLRN